MKNILAIPGSLRAASYNHYLLNAFKAAATDGVSVEVLSTDEIRAVPLYDQDLEASFPAAVAALKAKIRAADGIIIATPEFNRSIPGVLKNLIDWTSRPYGDNAWAGKHVFVTGASMGPIAAALAQYDVKKVMNYLDALVMGQPEFYLGAAHEKFDAAGVLTDDKTKETVAQALAAFVARIG